MPLELLPGRSLPSGSRGWGRAGGCLLGITLHLGQFGCLVIGRIFQGGHACCRTAATCSQQKGESGEGQKGLSH